MVLQSDLEIFKEIPGYKAILKSVLKSQIQLLMEQLSEHTGEESIILTASVNDGTLSNLGSNTGKGFFEGRDEIKTQFLGYCLKTHHKQKTQEVKMPYQRTHPSPRASSQQPGSMKRARYNPMARASPGESSLQPPDRDSQYTAMSDDSNLSISGSGGDLNIKHESQMSSAGISQSDPSSAPPSSFATPTSASIPSTVYLPHTQTEAGTVSHSGDSAFQDNNSDSIKVKLEPGDEEDELEITGIEMGHEQGAQEGEMGEGHLGYGDQSGDSSFNQSGDPSLYKWPIGSPWQSLSFSKGGLFNKEEAEERKQIEIVPGSGVCIPIHAKDVVFSCTKSRTDLAAKLLRAFYGDILKYYNSLSSLPDSDDVIPAIIKYPAISYDLQESPYSDDRESMLICPECGKAFRSKCDIARHMLIHSGSRPYPCSVCGKAFRRKHHMSDHMRCVHQEHADYCSVKEIERSLMKKPSKKYPCRVCGHVFNKRFNLKRHYVVHSGVKELEDPSMKYTCHVCGCEFKKSFNLKQHYVDVHSGVEELEHSTMIDPSKKYPCLVCGRVFKKGFNLKRHYVVHSGVKELKHSQMKDPSKTHSQIKDPSKDLSKDLSKKYPCHVCGRVFKKSFNLKKHNIIHSGDVEELENSQMKDPSKDPAKKYPCHVCGRVFKKSFNLKKHNVIHSGDVEELESFLKKDPSGKYPCSLCSRVFNKSFNLKRHYAVHSGDTDRPYACGTCEMHFLRKYDLQRHMRFEHPEVYSMNSTFFVSEGKGL